MRVQIKNIICSTDFSEYSDHGVSYGIALAKKLGARLYVCHVIDLSSIAMYRDGAADPLEHRNWISNYALEYIDQLIGQQSLDWEPLIQIGHPANEISRMAHEKLVDLAILTTHGRSGLKRLILGSVTERLMRTLPCPLLIVHNSKHDLISVSRQGIRVKKILIGCDFSTFSNLAFQYGLSLAQEFQSELYLAHVIQPSIYRDLLKGGIEYSEELGQDLRDHLYEKLFNMVPEEARNWCTPVLALLAGQPCNELTKYAVVHRVDLIVLGVRGQSMVEMLFIGSTTDRVARQVPCAVLSVCPLSK